MSANDADDFELWKLQNGVVSQVKDLCPGSSGGFSDLASRPLGNLVFFQGLDADHGWEPWITDGSAAGTTMIDDLRPGTEGSDPKTERSSSTT